MKIVVSPQNKARIEVIDALRGSALLGLCLLHTIEHFDFMAYPETAPAWVKQANAVTQQWGYFLFGGKAYAIFAMMFGLSFALIMGRAALKGTDFSRRFAWRLIVLLAIGYTFGLIYCGEILTMLAVLGLPLIWLYRVKTRYLAVLSALLLLQLPFWWQVGQLLTDPAYSPAADTAGHYYGKLGEVFSRDGFLEVLKINAWTGVQARWSWSIENGRYLQMFGLFLWGLMLGRSRLFEDSKKCARVAGWAFLTALAAYWVFHYGQDQFNAMKLAQPLADRLGRIAHSYLTLSQMVIWASSFTLLYLLTPARQLLKLLAPFGRTSLSCYISQSVVGVVLFYHFGFGLFRIWGEFYSVLFGMGVFILQCVAAHLWLKHFHYGPLEWFWRSCTMLSFRTPLRRGAAAATEIKNPEPAAVG